MTFDLELAKGLKMIDEYQTQIEQLLAESIVIGPKNSKTLARRSYNRRKIWLGLALEQMEIAISRLKEQPGKLYKAKEVETLEAAVRTFRDATGLKGAEPLSQEQMDHIMSALINGKPWEPPSDDVMAELMVVVDRMREDGWALYEGSDENSAIAENWCALNSYKFLRKLLT